MSAAGIDVPESVREHAQHQIAALGPLLVATDGTAASKAAIRAAAQLAKHTETSLVVLTVLETVPLIAADYGIMIPPGDTEQARRDALYQRVKLQVEEIAGMPANVSIELREGDPAAVIARTARELGAQL